MRGGRDLLAGDVRESMAGGPGLDRPPRRAELADHGHHEVQVHHRRRGLHDYGCPPRQIGGRRDEGRVRDQSVLGQLVVVDAAHALDHERRMPPAVPQAHHGAAVNGHGLGKDRLIAEVRRDPVDRLSQVRDHVRLGDHIHPPTVRVLVGEVPPEALIGEAEPLIERIRRGPLQLVGPLAQDTPHGLLRVLGDHHQHWLSRAKTIKKQGYERPLDRVV
jgi:hypothetical protein